MNHAEPSYESGTTLRRKALDAIIRSLDVEPQLWAWRKPSDPTVVKHERSEIGIWWWKGSGPYLYEPSKVTFGFWGRRRLRDALRRWRSVQGRRQENAAADSACQYVIARLSPRASLGEGL